MNNMVIPLLHNEIAKAARTKLPYFGLMVTSVLCFLIFVVTGAVLDGETLNAWGYTSLSMQLVFTDIGLIFIAVFASMLIAEETAFGTVRAVLSSPLLRWEFYTAKVLTGLLYAVVMSVVSLVISACLGSVNYQFGDVADSMGMIYANKEVLLNFIMAFFLSWVPLAALVMYGIFVSTAVRKSGQAVAVAIGTIYLIDFTKHIVGIDPYIFTRYIGFSWRIFNQVAQGVDYQWSPEVWKMIAMSLIYCFVMFAGGLVIFSKRDLNG
jgi:ABC-type transport system involved in multi-copper enzyme maturation permease subunit